MVTKGIALVSGATLLALTGTASAGPMSVASPQTVALKSQIEPAYRHYGHRHYGWYRHR